MLSKRKARFEGVDFHEDIRLELLEEWTYREIGEAAGLSPSFVGRVMRGERTPGLEYWEDLAQLAR